jgi:galacturan 1,4-alpha-galacturonidase
LISNRGVFDIIQCTSFSGYTGNCNTSTLAISDLDFGNIQGTVVAGVTRLGTFDCSGAVPCHNITISGVNVEMVGNGSQVQGYSCTAVEGTTGFSC